MTRAGPAIRAARATAAPTLAALAATVATVAALAGAGAPAMAQTAPAQIAPAATAAPRPAEAELTAAGPTSRGAPASRGAPLARGADEAAAHVVATRPIPARTVLTAADLRRLPGAAPGAVRRLAAAVGMETRTALYSGQPVRADAVGPPTLVERNEVVTMLYRRAALTIATEARALGRGGLGERVRVMNLDSRRTLFATVAAPGLVEAH